MDIKLKSYLLLSAITLSGAVLPIIFKFSGGANIFEFFLLIELISLLTSLIVVVYRKKAGVLMATLKDIRKTALIAFIGVITYFPIGFGLAFAERYVSASLAYVIFRVQPIMVVALLPFVLNEKLTKYQIAAIMLGFIGLYIGISGGNVFGIFQNSNIEIELFLVFMALAYALSVVLAKKYTIDIGVMISISSFAMLVLYSVLFLVSGAHFYALTQNQAAIVLYIGVFFNVFSFYMYFSALRLTKASLFANISFIQPFITFILAAALLGEPIKFYYIAIALLVGAGIVIQNIDKEGGRYVSKMKEHKLRSMTIFDVTGIFADTGEIALNRTIMEGGRVFAVKLDNEHSKNVEDMISEGKHVNVYTDSHNEIREESAFVKDILGASDGEFVVMKAGRIEECEGFLEKLNDLIGADANFDKESD